MTQRVRDGEIDLVHIPGVSQVVNCFTKWVKESELDASIAYLTNVAARMQANGETYAVLCTFAERINAAVAAVDWQRGPWREPAMCYSDA